MHGDATRKRVFGILFLTYAAFYFCRVNLPVALPLLEDAYHFSKTQTGWILSVYFAVYSLSKLANGFLGDRFGGKRFLLVGIAGSVVANVLFGFGGTIAAFTVLWSVNAYFQSMGWLALVSIMAHWYRLRETGTAMGFMSLSYQLGDFAARSSAGLLLGVLVWFQMFWAHAGLFALVGVAVLALLPGHRSTEDRPDAETPGEWRRAMLASRSFWLVVLVGFLLSTLRYVFWGWSVSYLAEMGTGIVVAGVSSAFFPLFGALGTLSAGWISDRMGARRGPVIAVMGVLLTLSIFIFSRIPGDQTLGLVLALGLVGFNLYGPYSILTGTMAMDFGWKFSSASAAGIIDGVGAVGAVFTGVGMGYLIDRFGWDRAFSVVIALAVVSALLSFGLWRVEPRDRGEGNA